MTANKCTTLTTGTRSVASSGWNLLDQQPGLAIPSDTRARMNDHVLMVQGRIVEDTRGAPQVVVTVDPAAIDRKLAIKRANERLEGHTPRTNTFLDLKARR